MSRRNAYIFLSNSQLHYYITKMKFIVALRLKIFYVLVYSLEFAPIKLWFKRIKYNQKTNIPSNKIDYSKDDGNLVKEDVIASKEKSIFTIVRLK